MMETELAEKKIVVKLWLKEKSEYTFLIPRFLFAVNITLRAINCRQFISMRRFTMRHLRNRCNTVDIIIRKKEEEKMPLH